MKLVAAAIGLQACLTVSLLTAQQQQAPQQQTITFDTIAAQVAGGSVTLSAKATSGLPVSFASSTPAVCAVSGTPATLISAGTCIVQASQAGTPKYAVVTPASQSIATAAQPATSQKKNGTSGSQTTQYTSIDRKS